MRKYQPYFFMLIFSIYHTVGNAQNDTLTALVWEKFELSQFKSKVLGVKCDCKVLDNDTTLFILPNYNESMVKIETNEAAFTYPVKTNEYFKNNWVGWSGNKTPTPLTHNEHSAFSNYLDFLFLNKPFPNISFQGINENSFDSKSLEGKISLILFTMDRCVPCRWLEEKIHLLSEEHQSDRRVQFYAFNRDSTVKKLPDAFIQFTGAKELMREIPVFSYPTIYVVDQFQTIKMVEKGAVPPYLPNLLKRLDEFMDDLKTTNNAE